MTDSQNSLVAKFHQEGFVLLPSALDPSPKSLRTRCLSVFSEAASHHGIGPITTDAQLIALYKNNHDVWKAGYHQLKYLPETWQLATSEALQKVARSLGIEFPALCGTPVVRVDMRKDEKDILGAHQDFPYHRGSHNSLTFWIPLQDTDAPLGPVAVAKGSHRDGEIETEQGIISDSSVLEKYSFESCPVAADDMLVMSQMLVHRSGINRSEKVRFSLQVRFNDLADAEYGKRHFFVNEGSTQKFVRVNR